MAVFSHENHSNPFIKKVNTDFQLKMNAMAYNLKHWHTFVKEKEKA